MVKERDFPEQSSLNGWELGPHYRDAFVFSSSQTGMDAVRVYQAIFGHLPKSVLLALKLRDYIVTRLGFSASSGNMTLRLEEIKVGNVAGFLTFESVSEQEVISASTEKNMDLWLSVVQLSSREFAVATLVNLKTVSGRFYMKLITPFHKLIAKYCIAKALKAGRI